jgi:preprotein translocase SecE subunit
VADKRQRSKQRQAERRAQRLSGRSGATESGGTKREPGSSDGDRVDDRRDAELEEQVDLQVGAPPEELGTPEFSARHENPPPPDFDVDDDELFDEDTGDVAPNEPGTRGPRGVRGKSRPDAPAPGAPTKERGGARLLEFLKAVWAELKRVQWPNRRQLTQLTGVVLFFIVIVGVYLGALDAILSKLISEIL